MREKTRWERFKENFVWGNWSTRDPRTGFLRLWTGRDDFAGMLVVGKLKVYIPALRVRH